MMNPTNVRIPFRFVLGSVLVLLLAASRPAAAAPLVPEAPGTGTLVGRDADGKTVDFPLRHTDVRIEVSGFLARAQVTQQFTNPYDRRIEAVYVFPLPENAAVDDMTLVVGGRTIRGVIRERGEARQVYEQARANGQTAALLEQERPNIFTQSVANLLPGDDVKITITYVQTIKYEAGSLSLAFPMVVGPRYIPGHVTTPEGDAIPVTPRAACVPDADRITPPVLRPGTRSGHDVSIEVQLEAGVPYTNLRSKSHAIEDRRIGPTNASIRLAEGDAIPNQDFVLEWDVRPERVAAGMLAHREDADGFFTLMLVPAPSPRAGDVTPKEMVFVLDCSGSMSGMPIEASKSLVRHALGHLNPGDTFQILSFSMTASGMSPTPLSNTPANIARGLAYLDTLHGEGGTEMIQGIRAALAGGSDDRRLRVVLFLTDGYIGNETEILSEVRNRVGDARLYSLGVGTSVNRYLLENLALEGRGQVLYLRPGEDPAPAIARFYDQVRSPVMTRLSIDWGGLDVVDAWPATPPDLFAGHPLLVTARYRTAGAATVRVTGLIAGERVSIPVAVALPDRQPANPALRSLWARQAIEARMRLMLQGEVPDLVREVIALSVGNRVLSQYTAFVAVEQKARTNERGDPVKVEVPVEMPKDVSFEGVFGEAEEQEAAPLSNAVMTRMAPMKAVRRMSGPSSPPPSVAMGSVGYGTGGGGATAGYGRVYGLGKASVGLASVADSAQDRKAESNGPRQAVVTGATARDATAGLRSPAGPTVKVQRTAGIGKPALDAFQARLKVALASIADALKGSAAVLKVSVDAKGGLHVTAIEGMAAAPRNKEHLRKALLAAGLWAAPPTKAPGGTAEIIVTF
jgi:Ca-activated chloride channel family protein